MTDQFEFFSCVAEDCDAQALMQVLHDSVHGVANSHYAPSQLKAWSPSAMDASTAQKRLAGQQVFLAEDNEGLCAFMTLRNDSHLDFAFAHPRVIGKGVASAIYEQLLEYARRSGHRTLTSDISLAARTFFEKRGWQFLQEQIVERHGVALTNFKARLEITDKA